MNRVGSQFGSELMVRHKVANLLAVTITDCVVEGGHTAGYLLPCPWILCGDGEGCRLKQELQAEGSKLCSYP